MVLGRPSDSMEEKIVTETELNYRIETHPHRMKVQRQMNCLHHKENCDMKTGQVLMKKPRSCHGALIT